MFVGTEAALTAAAPLWTEASDQYAQAEKLTRAVTDALALADQTSAQIPYLAQWLCRPLPAGQSPATEDAEINDTLLKLIHGAAELNETLAAGPPPDASMTAQAAEFVQQAQAVRGQFEHLQGLLSKDVPGLKNSKKRTRWQCAACRACWPRRSSPAAAGRAAQIGDSIRDTVKWQRVRSG